MAMFVLVHAPLLGPAAWRPCAALLREQGHAVFTPDLRGAVRDAPAWWQRYVDGCVAVAGEQVDVVVGHSGSGVVLPLIATATDARTVVFADALLPARRGVTEPGDQIREFVRELPQDDRLPPWSRWWPAADVAELVGDAALRDAIFAEQPRLPADFYDIAVPVPDDWSRGRAVHYLQFSAAYEDDAAEARARGWDVVHVPGGHLLMADQPQVVCDAVLACLSAPGSASD
jgi:hypothetical protein